MNVDAFAAPCSVAVTELPLALSLAAIIDDGTLEFTDEPGDVVLLLEFEVYSR